jgi:ribosome biogenesis GTPase / thiamine phosphate phosphatase
MKTISENLKLLGWEDFFEAQLANLQSGTGFAARVIASGRKVMRVQAQLDSVLMAEVTGKIVHKAQSHLDFPSVGDWVWCEAAGEERATIKEIFKRKSVLVRKAAGSSFEEQVLCANVDTVFIVTSLNSDFNIARLERYLAMVMISGAQPVVVLTKADLCDDPKPFVDEVQNLGAEILVYAISSVTGSGLDQLKSFLTPGSTSVLLGSSGVGKSTLVNKLFQKQVADTGEIREDDAKGRHTTTERNLWHSPLGAMVIDTPGMRELQLWDDGSGLDAVFSDIEDIALQCKFTNCKHDKEPGCQIKAALADGRLSQDRYDRYLKLHGELRANRMKSDKEFASQEKQKSKKLGDDARARSQHKRRT